MPNNRKQYYHEGFKIQPSPPLLLMMYADPDQGGTQLQYCYRIYFSRDLKSISKTILTSGYKRWDRRDTEDIALDEIPQSVINDVLIWFKVQADISSQSGNDQQRKIFLDFIEAIENRK